GLAAGQAPQTDVVIRTPAGQELAVRTDGLAQDRVQVLVAVALEGPQGLPLRKAPEADLAVSAGTGQEPAIRTHGESQDAARMPLQHLQILAVRQTPQLDGAVRAAGGQ